MTAYNSVKCVPITLWDLAEQDNKRAKCMLDSIKKQVIFSSTVILIVFIVCATACMISANYSHEVTERLKQGYEEVDETVATGHAIVWKKVKSISVEQSK